MTIMTNDEKKAYIDGFEMCAECIESYMTSAGRKQLQRWLGLVRNALKIEDIEPQTGWRIAHGMEITTEEAKRNLKHAIRWNDMPKKEALEVAVKALDREPCEDAIEFSEKDAIKMLKSKMDGHTDTSYEWAETVRMAIKALEQESVLDEIRAEIKRLPYQHIFGNVGNYSLLDTVVEIIDKYRKGGTGN